ncbi:MAG: hypothetical protein DHS20C09_18780 [marine bacterium B5-7]|nr:MAG: hypothetical protein DHS20C09_18780 [marine bacterium B5-7]
MTTQNTVSNESNKPTHSVCIKSGHGKSAKFETIAVGWEREDGGLYIKPYGTQIIDRGFYAFPISDQNAEEESGQ